MAFAMPGIVTSHHQVLGTVGILLLSGTLAGWSSVAAAQTAPSSPPLPAERPPFLKQMPAPERVMADIQGSDQLDTAARQVAALNRLSDVVVTLSGTADAPGGVRLTTGELALNGRYAGAASSLRIAVYRRIDPDNKQQFDENSKRNQWNRQRDRYYNDPAFTTALLQGYLTPDLTATYLAHMRQTRQNTLAMRRHIQAAQQREAIQDAATRQNHVQETSSSGSLSFLSTVVASGVIGSLLLGIWWRRKARLSPEGDQRVGKERDSTLNSNLGSEVWRKPTVKCPNCGGSGKLRCPGPCIGGRLTCPVCSGHGCSTCTHTGRIPCSTCGGRGETACSCCH
jgi:hypothetical protein